MNTFFNLEEKDTFHIEQFSILACLQLRIETWGRQGVSLGYAAQTSELRAVRDAVPELAGYSYSAEQQVLRRLDKAFAAFFRRVKAGETSGFPRFRAK